MIIAVERATDAAEARRQAAALAEKHGFDQEQAGRVALVATELATNMVKHAEKGELVVQPYHLNGASGVELIAIDRGPGIADMARARSDGYSTAGSHGTGLGAIQRIADLVSVFTNPGQGTVSLARLAARTRSGVPARDAIFETGAVAAPHPGETVNGDAFAALPIRAGLCRLMIADGSGHGTLAAEAAAAATALFERQPTRGLVELVEMMHKALGHTRGAAIALAEIDRDARLVRYAGLGNIAGTLIGADGRRGMISAQGTVGHTWHTVREFTYPFADTATVVLHSDGIATRWQIDSYPGLGTCHPSVIAAVLYRDFRRGRDDATILVTKVQA